jgi:hypothetical protein
MVFSFLFPFAVVEPAAALKKAPRQLSLLCSRLVPAYLGGLTSSDWQRSHCICRVAFGGDEVWIRSWAQKAGRLIWRLWWGGAWTTHGICSE